MKNITFRVNDKILELARTRAKLENRSLNEIFIEWLNLYSGINESRKNYNSLMKKLSYSKPGKKFSRSELNER